MSEAHLWEASEAKAPFRFGKRTAIAERRLWTIGNRSILDQPLFGFFCSRRCSGDAIVQTYDLARGLRDAGVPVITGFHSPMEKECLDFLLRGRQPIVICPARSIERMRVPAGWRDSIESGRLLVIAPFSAKEKRTTADRAARRNRLVAGLAKIVFVAHIDRAGLMAELCEQWLSEDKAVWTFTSAEQQPPATGAQAFASWRDVLNQWTLT